MGRLFAEKQFSQWQCQAVGYSFIEPASPLTDQQPSPAGRSAELQLGAVAGKAKRNGALQDDSHGHEVADRRVGLLDCGGLRHFPAVPGFLEGLLSPLRMPWDHEPTPNPS